MVIPALDQLTPESRRQLLERLRREFAAAATRDFPLSRNQERLWLLERLEMGRGHTVSAALRLSGKLDTNALRAAHVDVLARHEILRTTFHEAEEKSFQRVHAAAVPAFELADEEETNLDVTIARVATEPFDLAKLPLLRSTILRLGPQEHVWIMTAHHIIFDGWSVGVFVRDVAAFYTARLRGEAATLAPLPLQYPAYAAAQRSPAEENCIERHVEWWRRRLEGAPNVLELPIDRNRQIRLSENGSVHFFELSRHSSERLRALCGSSGATLFMGLLAVFSALLARYSGQHDLVIGTPAANRGGKDREPAIGFFVSTLPLRIDLSGKVNFTELLRRMKETCVQAFVHQDVPFERIVNELKIVRDPSRNPLFQTMFGLRNMDTTFTLPNLEAVPLRITRTTSQFDLTLLMKETTHGIEGAFEYSTDLFDEATIARMGRHFSILVDSILTDPAAALSRTDFLTEEERSAISLGTYDLTQAKDPITEFQAVAQLRPDQAAVVSEAGALTYADLDRRSDRVAADLRSRGVGAEAMVGLHAKRTPGTIAGLLGILKAGAAFVPLDPEYPKERLAFMAEDSRIRVIVADAGEVLDFPRSLEYVRTDQERDTPFVVAQTDPECLAYAIYTSGSTGRPKGAAISRRALACFCRSARETYPVRAEDRVLQFASLSFDTALEEILPCLTAGGTLILRNDAMIEAPARLLEACRSHGVTILDLPTSWWRRLSAEMIQLGLTLPKSVHTVIIGGEACTREALEQWQKIGGHSARLLNTYGPTETCVVATMAELRQDPGVPPREIGIGTPLGHAYAVVVDSNLQPVPFGVLGELLIGGPGVARGYIGRPGLTAERFIPDFVGPGSGRRLYRTGDLVRLRPGGQIEYVGRADNQAKVRGFRVEPGEVESALLAYSGITSALAVPGDESLSAFVTLAQGAEIEIEALRRFLRDRMPYHMIPAEIHIVKKLSYLPNGKIDRHRIPAVESVVTAANADPLSDIEVKMAAIWKAILRVESISTRDNFFQLGGDSIMTIQVASRSTQQGLPMASRDVFEYQTIAELATELQSRRRRAIPRDEAAEAESPGPYRLSPVQQWFFDRGCARPSHFNQSVMVEIAGDADIIRLAGALRKVLARHEAFRLRFRREAGEWMQVLGPPLNADEVTIADRIDTAIQQQLDIENGPLIRVLLVPGSATAAGRLFAVAHHLAVDAVSWRLLIEEAAAAYAGSPLPPKTRPFTAWPGILAQYGASLSEDRKKFWLQRPGDSRALPLDTNARPESNTIASSDRVVNRLDAGDTEVLLRNTLSSLDARMDELVLTACCAALMRWTDSETLLMDLESHGRPDLPGAGDFSRTVGWFTSLYPVCFASGGSDLDQIHRNVRRTLRSIPESGVEYGVLRYLCADATARARLAAMPSGEISFNYLGQVDNALLYPFIGIAPESHGDVHDPMEVRSHALEINALIEAGELRVEWNYSRMLHQRETIRALADAVMENLHMLTAKDKESTLRTPTMLPKRIMQPKPRFRIGGNGNR